MTFGQLKVASADDRGLILDVASHAAFGQACVETFDFDHVTLVTGEPGAERGHHVHAHTRQMMVLVTGAATVAMLRPDGVVVICALMPYDYAIAEPGEPHAVRFHVQSTMLVVTQGPRAGAEFEHDTMRLDRPLMFEDSTVVCH